jgi:hypothetical protein
VIVSSLLLILVAVTLLVFGLGSGSSVLLVCSIAASLLAAVALVVGARQAAAARAGTGYSDDEWSPRAGDEDGERVRHHRSTARAHEPRRRRAAGWATGESPTTVVEPLEATPQGHGTYRPAAADAYERTRVADPRGSDATDLGDSDLGRPGYGRDGVAHAGAGFDDDDHDDESDPADEPAAQVVPAADAARVARMSAPVLVIDGRPRYHAPGCVHLSARESEPLPVSEAIELGFTPCGLCEPASALLADAGRV